MIARCFGAMNPPAQIPVISALRLHRDAPFLPCWNPRITLSLLDAPRRFTTMQE
jgi:hypothetical protein